MKKLAVLASLTLLAASLPSGTRADTIAFTTGGSATVNSAGSATVGYTFTLANSVFVTQLGFWDNQANGLLNAVPVTIWNSSGVSLATATVPSGTTAGEVNQYLFTTLATPVSLAPGTYTIGAYITNINDFYQYNVTTITGATGVTYGAPRFVQGNSFPATDGFGAGRGYFGPNFQYVVPEPSTWALLCSGTLTVGVIALRRRVV